MRADEFWKLDALGAPLGAWGELGFLAFQMCSIHIFLSSQNRQVSCSSTDIDYQCVLPGQQLHLHHADLSSRVALSPNLLWHAPATSKKQTSQTYTRFIRRHVRTAAVICHPTPSDTHAPVCSHHPYITFTLSPTAFFPFFLPPLPSLPPRPMTPQHPWPPTFSPAPCPATSPTTPPSQPAWRR